MKDSNSVLDNLEIIKSSERNVILFGSFGVGKTTLLNKICGKNFPTDYKGSNSCTRDAQFARSLKGNNIIIDFPGLNSFVDFAKYLKVHETVLSMIPVRLICFVIKYRTRYDDLIRDFNQMLLIFKDYRNNIMLIITNTEEMTIKSKLDIENILKKNNVKNIFFSNLTTIPEEIINRINNEIEKTENIENIIIKNELYKQVKDKNVGSINFDIIDKRKEYLEKFRKAKALFIEELSKAKDNELRRELYFALKKYQDKLLEEFKEEIKNIPKEENDDDNDNNIDISDYIYLHSIIFKNESFRDLKEFKDLVEKGGILTKFFLLSNRECTFRKCPYCGQIWFLYTGSESFTCGGRILNKDLFNCIEKEYTVNFDGNKIEIKCFERVPNFDSQYLNGERINGLTQKEIEENKIRAQKNKHLIKPLGCGEKFIWSKCEDVTQQVENFLNEISMSDYYSV